MVPGNCCGREWGLIQTLGLEASPKAKFTPFFSAKLVIFDNMIHCFYFNETNKKHKKNLKAAGGEKAVIRRIKRSLWFIRERAETL